MAKNAPLGIRFEPDEREALDKAAAADARTTSALARKVLVDWLRSQGKLAGESQS